LNFFSRFYSWSSCKELLKVRGIEYLEGPFSVFGWFSLFKSEWTGMMSPMDARWAYFSGPSWFIGAG